MTEELNNPALKELAFLIGDWDMALSGAAFLPTTQDVVHDSVTFRPIESGALLTMHQGSNESGPPKATWVMGKDDSDDHYTVLYADERGVSRLYSMDMTPTIWRIWRDDPDFSQRFEATVSSDRRSLVGRWEKRSGGGTWSHDFDVTYTRV